MCSKLNGCKQVSAVRIGSGNAPDRAGSGLQAPLRLPAVGAGSAAGNDRAHPTYSSLLPAGAGAGGGVSGGNANASPLLTQNGRARTMSSLLGLSLPSNMPTAQASSALPAEQVLICC